MKENSITAVKISDFDKSKKLSKKTNFLAGFLQKMNGGQGQKRFG